MLNLVAHSSHGRWLRFKLKLIIAALIFFTPIMAQGQELSTDAQNPTPMSSAELTVAGPKKLNQQYFYGFTGGPGEVTLTITLRAKTYSTFAGIKVLDAELNTLASHNMSADTSSPGLATKKFDVAEKQKLLLSFTSDPNLAECKIKFGGAVEFGGGEVSPSSNTDSSGQTNKGDAGSPPSGSTDDSGSTATSESKNKTFAFSILDAAGQRFNIPANGKLRVEMKDGSVQEIDLTQVKKILIRN